MIEKVGNILNPDDTPYADAICFTSNGILTRNGDLVMGAGVAKAFKQAYPHLPRIFGALVANQGNHVHVDYLTTNHGLNESLAIVSFPTKVHWKDQSPLWLIRQSALELLKLTNEMKWKKVYLTRPGCGNGGHEWYQINYQISWLDNRFIVINPR